MIFVCIYQCVLQESNVLIIPERENESLDNPDDENVDEDAGYPQSPDSDVPESTFSNPNRVRCSLLRGMAYKFVR